MTCPICDNKPMNCDCTEEAKQLYMLRAEIAEREMENEADILDERRKWRYTFAGQVLVSVRDQGYTFKQAAEIAVKHADALLEELGK